MSSIESTSTITYCPSCAITASSHYEVSEFGDLLQRFSEAVKASDPTLDTEGLPTVVGGSLLQNRALTEDALQALRKLDALVTSLPEDSGDGDHKRTAEKCLDTVKLRSAQLRYNALKSELSTTDVIESLIKVGVIYKFGMSIEDFTAAMVSTAALFVADKAVSDWLRRPSAIDLVTERATQLGFPRDFPAPYPFEKKLCAGHSG